MSVKIKILNVLLKNECKQNIFKGLSIIIKC